MRKSLKMFLRLMIEFLYTFIFLSFCRDFNETNYVQEIPIYKYKTGCWNTHSGRRMLRNFINFTDYSGLMKQMENQLPSTNCSFILVNVHSMSHSVH